MTRISSRLSAAVSSIRTPAPSPNQKLRISGKGSHTVVRDRLDLGSEKISEGAVNEIVLGGVKSSVRDALSKADVRAASGADVRGPADASPEATAHHIFEFTTGPYREFRVSRPDLSENEARSQYSAVIGEAVNSGIDGAVAVLRGLSALMNAELFNKVERTRSLVNNMVSTFLNGGPQ